MGGSGKKKCWRGSGRKKKKEPTRKLNGVDLLRLQNVEQRIYKTRLRFGLKNPQKDNNKYG